MHLDTKQRGICRKSETWARCLLTQFEESFKYPFFRWPNISRDLGLYILNPWEILNSSQTCLIYIKNTW